MATRFVGLPILVLLLGCGSDREGAQTSKETTPNREIRLLSPLENAVVRSAFRAEAEVKGDTGVEVRFLLDGVEKARVSSPPYAADIDVSSAPGGRRILTVVATDPIGRENAAFLPVRVVARIAPQPLPGNWAFYATFASSYQRMVSNRYGIFATFLHPDPNETNLRGSWTLQRSVDGGATFTPILSGPDDKAPAVETDPEGTIYLLVNPPIVDTSVAESAFYRLAPEFDFKGPIIRKPIPRMRAIAKMTMLYDPERKQIYAASGGGTSHFAVLDQNGELIHGPVRMVRMGTNEFGVKGPFVDIPVLSLSNTGDLVYGWSSGFSSRIDHDNCGEARHVRVSVHMVLSTDGGVTWRTPLGNPIPTDLETQEVSEPPIYTDGSYPETVNLPEEWNFDPFFESIFARGSRLHLAYRSLPVVGERQYYVRFTSSPETGAWVEDRRISPEWAATQNSIDVVFSEADSHGFFVSDGEDPNSTIFFAGRSRENRIVVIGSDDDGDTWYDVAESDILDERYYFIGGCRRLTSDGCIIGAYTDRKPRPYRVKFFKIRVK